MIVFMTLVYCALLALLVKLKIVPWNTLTKASPAIWMLFLFVVLFLPMQFYAPAGVARVLRHSVQIVPNVAGVVTEVSVEPNVPLKKGDILFQIDPTPFEAKVRKIEAELDLAKLRLKQASALESSAAGRLIDVQRYQAQVRQLEAQLVGARWDFESTTVRAPADGFVTNLALREGARVAAVPLAPSMAFIDTSETALIAQIPQNFLRHVRFGTKAEIALKFAPGEIFELTVVSVIEATAEGQVQVTGLATTAQQIAPNPMIVRLEFDDDRVAKRMPAGAVGQVALYTNRGAATHVIRKVMLRMTSWINFINPY